MSTISQADGRVARLCRSALMLALAFGLSFLEHLLPLQLLLPLPGVKLGLANIVTVVLFYFVSPIDAAVVSLLRIGLSALLFGTPISFLFSLMGGGVAYLTLWISKSLFPHSISFVGVSVLGATGHHFGQILVAVLLFDSGVLFGYLPVLLVAGCLMGGVGGLLLNVLSKRLEKVLKGA